MGDSEAPAARAARRAPRPRDITRQGQQRGLEPDECYKLGSLHDDDVPDLAVEVIVSSGLIDKMAVYAGLGVSEVWVWTPHAGDIAVHRLVDR